MVDGKRWGYLTETRRRRRDSVTDNFLLEISATLARSQAPPPFSSPAPSTPAFAETCSTQAVVAEAQGFEPWRACALHAFQACALDHYATPPLLEHLTI